jgi:hypothetical protein
MSFWAHHVTNICLTSYNLQNPVSRNPDELKGEQIRLTVRILQSNDIYDALSADRPYRAVLPQRSHRRARSALPASDGLK